MAANFQEVGEAFAKHYYSVFDRNRTELQALYVSPLLMLGPASRGRIGSQRRARPRLRVLIPPGRRRRVLPIAGSVPMAGVSQSNDE